ncbi:type II secretion system protein GspM [Kiritimatiellota bacterium B12222]|nr:type II secretion system protein GspM [Kiritimatiellota bacterium B12222]
MKKLNSREQRLAIITGLVLLVALSYQLIKTQLTNLKNLERRQLNAQVEAKRQTTLLAQRPDLIEQLESVRGQLPSHPEEKDLNSELARQVQNLASQTGLRLTGLTPEPEIYYPDLHLYQAAVKCTWSGSSENLVLFLLRLNAQGAVADIREIRIRNRNGMSDTLTGTFILDFAYSRIPASEWEVEIDTTSASAETP